MQKCTLYHTGVYMSADGVIKDNRVYLLMDNDRINFPEQIFMTREECEGGLIQFEVDGKWGFADIYTGEIKIKPIWDYAGPFYRGYAHVALGTQVESNGHDVNVYGGKHGYIGTDGDIAIPLIYDDSNEIPYRQYFIVANNQKWGVIDQKNKIKVPLHWNRLVASYSHDLIFCYKEEFVISHEDPENRVMEDNLNYVQKWGVYNHNFVLIVQPDIDEIIRPKIKHNPKSRDFSYYENYFILKRKTKYGVICSDGRWIADIKLSKEQAIDMLNLISRQYSGNLYI